MPHTINYEHEVNDEIFFMHKNKVSDRKIEEVQINIKKSQFANSVAKIIYSISFDHPSTNSNEKINLKAEDVFATKQELLDSL